MLLSPLRRLENVIANCHKRLRKREREDTTPVTDTQAYFIGLLIYMQAHTVIFV